MKTVIRRITSRLFPSQKATDKADARVAAPFIPQNDLEEALISAATEPEKHRAFNSLIVAADLYAASEDGMRSFDGGLDLPEAAIGIFTVRGHADKLVPALFTSGERVTERFGKDARVIRMRGRDILNRVLQDGAILNPGLGYGIYWTSKDLANLLGAPLLRTVDADTKIALSTPAHPPSELIETLTQLLKSDGRVTEAWFALANWPHTSEPSWYADLRSSWPSEQLARDLTQQLRDTPMAGHPLDIVINTPGCAAGKGIRIKPNWTH